jgi:hypothetical protein
MRMTANTHAAGHVTGQTPPSQEEATAGFDTILWTLSDKVDGRRSAGCRLSSNAEDPREPVRGISRRRQRSVVMLSLVGGPIDVSHG